MISLSGKASDFLKVGVKAAARGDLQLVKELLKLKPNWLYHVGSHGRTMLWEACHKGKLIVVKYLIERGANVDACGTHYTPYFVELSCYAIAMHKKHEAVAEFLLDVGAKIDIHTAAFLGDKIVVEKILQEDSICIHEGHPQHIMAEKNSQGLEFISEVAPWATPLCYAVRGKNKEIVELLLERGAKTKGIERQLFISADKDYNMMKILLESDIDLSHCPKAMPYEQPLFDLLRDYKVPGASIYEISEELVYLCRGDRGGNVTALALMIANGADVNHQDAKGKTATHRAAKAGFVNALKLLLKHGADLSLMDSKGETPIFDLLRSTIKNVDSKKKCFDLLIVHGADLDHENNKGVKAKELLGNM